ncbi:toxin-antitoxin system YwqK family antitoxin [Saprospira grandis]|uniref:MORN repeat-containing protein n=1 Tax=Saprospira grandis (strain Lewin) TaxID=984262 RepID=H6L0H1_SAPGL|nr:hypothetical protein [Saprospira grandis]AFC23401.1 hypothetical protein SGRA_0662 [Saprospira grandis str. Lewin]
MTTNVKYLLIPLLALIVISCFKVKEVSCELTYYDKFLLKYKDSKGLVTGKVVCFYEDGSVSSRGTYKNGIKDGSWEIYDHSGTVIQNGTYSVDSQLTRFFEKFMKASLVHINQWKEGEVEILDFYIYKMKPCNFSLDIQKRVETYLKSYMASKGLNTKRAHLNIVCEGQTQIISLL